MNRIACSLIAILVFVSNAYGQDVRRLSLEEFFGGVEFNRYGQNFDFANAGRPLHVYTVVSVPAGELKLNSRPMYAVNGDDTLTTYLAVIDGTRTVSVKEQGGKSVEREASIRILFTCSKRTTSECRTALQSVLQNGGQMQSAGVGNYNESPSSNVPEGNLVFAFIMRESGKI